MKSDLIQTVHIWVKAYLSTKFHQNISQKLRPIDGTQEYKMDRRLDAQASLHRIEKVILIRSL